jgi:hypothetical protein
LRSGDQTNSGLYFASHTTTRASKAFARFKHSLTAESGTKSPEQSDRFRSLRMASSNRTFSGAKPTVRLKG